MALKRRKKEEMPKLSKEEQARVDKFVEYLFLAFIILAVICTIIVYKTTNCILIPKNGGDKRWTWKASLYRENPGYMT